MSDDDLSDLLSNICLSVRSPSRLFCQEERNGTCVNSTSLCEELGGWIYSWEEGAASGCNWPGGSGCVCCRDTGTFYSSVSSSSKKKSQFNTDDLLWIIPVCILILIFLCVCFYWSCCALYQKRREEDERRDRMFAYYNEQELDPLQADTKYNEDEEAVAKKIELVKDEGWPQFNTDDDRPPSPPSSSAWPQYFADLDAEAENLASPQGQIFSDDELFSKEEEEELDDDPRDMLSQDDNGAYIVPIQDKQEEQGYFVHRDDPTISSLQDDEDDYDNQDAYIASGHQQPQEYNQATAGYEDNVDDQEEEAAHSFEDDDQAEEQHSFDDDEDNDNQAMSLGEDPMSLGSEDEDLIAGDIAESGSAIHRF